MKTVVLSMFTTDATGELDVFWHDGDSLCVDGAQVGGLEKSKKKPSAFFSFFAALFDTMLDT